MDVYKVLTLCTVLERKTKGERGLDGRGEGGGGGVGAGGGGEHIGLTP